MILHFDLRILLCTWVEPCCPQGAAAGHGWILAAPVMLLLGQVGSLLPLDPCVLLSRVEPCCPRAWACIIVAALLPDQVELCCP